ncbi:hypothetical protein M501DRAFT_1006966 [Patellaria atrata CBS 101060]|uniref:Uncharacterized protein n=1 Tax=Patellaria atrata CBS 101060 TaxID=1346257 RepID=A0A9P4VP93_9PEZI|nr:hypothetical protein M501DRAFT_1006966 [Patellaria atrata CBS 101060]
MPPTRRYLRLTKHTVLETRIYLDDPSQLTWLLRPGAEALPRIVQAVRGLVLPKLREENERAVGKGKGKGRGRVRDVVVGDDFEVSVFLTERSAGHALLTKQKIFREKGERMRGNAGKLTGWLTRGTGDVPVEITDETVVVREEDEGEGAEVALGDIPEVGSSRGKRPRRDTGDEDDGLFVDSSTGSDVEDQTHGSRRHKRKKHAQDGDGDGDVERGEEKKKLALNTSYDGFSIYGRILCLVVKRRGQKSTAASGKAPESSQQMLENWVSTQAAQDQGDDDEDDG